MKVIKQTTDIHESVMDVYARHLAEKNAAQIAYLAMMANLDIEENKEAIDESNVQ